MKLAQSPDQVRAISTAVTSTASFDLRTHGSAFIRGGRLGLEILFP